MSAVDPRQVLTTAAEAAGASLSALSRLIRRNPAYLQQYVARGSPRRLDEEDRRLLAGFLGVEERLLGAPAVDRPSRVARRIDVAASAGPGSTVEQDELLHTVEIGAGLLRIAGARGGSDLTLVRARGDSMEPTILDGSDLLVDLNDRAVTARAGVFVIRVDDTVLVKRVRCGGGLLTITSDNPAAAAVGERAVEEVTVIGRVIWLGRRL